MERVITFGLEDNFIQRLGAFVQEEFIGKGVDLSRVAFVFGGKRPALFLKRELSRCIGKSFFSPRFFSMEEFIEYLLRKKQPFSNKGALESCFSLYELARREAPSILEGRASFSQFLPWAKEILAFLDQLDLEDVEKPVLQNIQLNASIGYDVPQNVNKLLEVLLAMRGSFHALLLKDGSYSRGMKYLLASRYVSDLSWNEFGSIVFCGFSCLHSTETKIIKHLYGAQKAFLVFQGDQDEWPILRDISRDLSIEIKPSSGRSAGSRVHIHAGFDLHSQVGIARELLKAIDDPRDTVIVLPEPDHAIALLSEIASSVDDLNVSLGYPLSRSSLYSLFEMIVKAQQTRKDGKYYSRDYLKVLSHPLVKNFDLGEKVPISRILAHKIEEILLGMEETDLAGSSFVALDEIEELGDLYRLSLAAMEMDAEKIDKRDLKNVLKELHMFAFRIWEGLENFQHFSTVLSRFLEMLARSSFIDRYPLDLKVADKVFEVRDALVKAAFKNEKFLPQEIFWIFMDILDGEMIAFSGTPLKGLQVLGLLETRSLNFKNVIVMDMNESSVPKLKIYEPLIPRDVMLSLGLNRLEKEEEIQRYQFKRLIAAADHVHLIYQDKEDKQRSRFIEELVWEEEKKNGELGVVPVLRSSFNVVVAPKNKGMEKAASEMEFLEKYRYSPSAINVYLNCPLRFYYQVVLGLREKDDIVDEPQAKDIGTFVHDLLEETFTQFIGKPLKIDKKFQDYFFDIFSQRFESEFRKKMKSDAFLLRGVLEYRLKRFLEYEKARRIKELLCLERPLEEDLNLGGITYAFQCRLDRIDVLADESLLIIDYKTGGADIMPGRWDKIREAGFTTEAIKKYLKSFQLPLYYHFVQLWQPEANINAGLYNLRDAGKTTLKTIFKDGLDFSGKKEAGGIFMEALKTVMSEILDPSIPFKADCSNDRYCQTCPFFYLCR